MGELMGRLDEVYDAIAEDPFWDRLRLPGIKLVPGYGQASRPSTLIVGEAPGATENTRLRPFCGPSGRVLAHLMATAGLHLDPKPLGGHKRDCDHTLCQVGWEYPANAYVTNVVKYRPPGNRTPTLGEIHHAKSALRQEWAALGKPKVIVLVGGTAHMAMHPQRGMMSLSDCVRHPMQSGESGIWFISQFHPAFGLRRGEATQRGMTSHWAQMGDWMREHGYI